ncbi:uncharacterized protein LOC123524956 [Mercenaria mercenaria]|uniref:uncharacterized protein LOC123524956 n=1 Tax=Mercenaria mercenaria TaxID=6596 RepID=UPI00234F75E0|nr:uncharacterized protein LOC123524956 [Mercenaria mercenaria]
MSNDRTMDQEEKESLALNSFLDSIELSQEDIKSRVSLFSHLEALAGAVDYQPDFQQTSITGSTMDGVYWKGYESDLDTMVHISYVTVLEKGKSVETNKGPVFEMVDEQVHPGYTRLKLIKEGPWEENNIFSTTPEGAKSFCVEENGNYFLSAYKMKYASNLYLHVPEKPVWVVQSSYAYGVEWPDDVELLEHGPSICFTDQSKKDEPPSDMVPSFTCPEWPTKAMEWVTRKRTHWPTDETVKSLVKKGCRVVPVGFRGSKTKHIEWRISFTLTERSLIKTFNNTQYKCYALLKMLLKEIINKEVPEVLSSFHMKNTLLWTIEKTDAETWKPARLTYAFMECVRNLVGWVKEGYCPSYFIVENNVFDMKVVGEDQKKLVTVLENVVANNWKSLLMCETFKKNDRFIELIQGQSEEFLDGIVEDFKGNDANEIWFNHDKKLFERYEHARTEIFSQLDHQDDIGLAIANHHQMITKLQGERSPSEFHGTVIKPLVLSVKSNLGSHLFALNQMQNDETGETLKMAKELMETGKASDATSGPLKLASFEFMTGNTARCLQLTENIILNQHLFPTHLPQFLPKYIGPTDGQLEKYRYFVSSSMTVADRFQSSAAHAVIFFPSEIDAAPNAVRFQLNTRVPEAVQHISWLKWAVYDPLVFAHFLRFLCYQKTRDAEKYQEELHAIETMLDRDEVGYEMSALNLLGFSYMSVNNLEKGMGYLQKAKDMALLPDATLWQLGNTLSAMLCNGKGNFTKKIPKY